MCSQRSCQLSSRGKEWSLGLEGFPGGSAAMNLPAAQETRVSSGQEPADGSPPACVLSPYVGPAPSHPSTHAKLWIRAETRPSPPSSSLTRGCVCTCVRAKSLQARVTLLPCGRQPAGLLYPWDFPGKSTGVGHHFLLWGTF